MRKDLIVMLLLVASFASAQNNVESEFLKVSLVNQEPDPVGPGEYVDIRLQVGNLGDEAVEGVEMELRPEFPFSLDPGDNALVDVGTLTAFQNQDRAFIHKYKVRVSDDAVEGTNTIEVRVRTSATSWSSYVFDINIRTSDANLGIESVTATPETVEPGSDATITIKVKNLADSVLKDVSMNLDLGLSTVSSTGADLDSLPFATLDSGTEKRMRQLSPGQEAYFTYKIRAYPSATSRVYKIPLRLEYKDELNTEYTKDNLIGIVVNSEPDISAVLEETEVTKAGDSGEVTIKFINKGLTDIKFVDVLIGESDHFDLLSAKEVYIGNVDSDDYETAEYEIYVHGDATGNLMLPISYTYMDANNNDYSVEKDIELRLFSEEEQEKLSNGGQDTTVIAVVVVIALLIIALIVWRVTKRRKH